MKSGFEDRLPRGESIGLLGLGSHFFSPFWLSPPSRGDGFGNLK